MQSTWQVPLNELFGGPKNGQLVSAVRLQLARSCCSARLASPWLSRSLTAVWIFREVINSNWQAGNIIQHSVAAALASPILLTWHTFDRLSHSPVYCWPPSRPSLRGSLLITPCSLRLCLSHESESYRSCRSCQTCRTSWTCRSCCSCRSWYQWTLIINIDWGPTLG